MKIPVVALALCFVPIAAAAESAPIAPNLARPAELIVINQKTLRTKKDTRLFPHPSVSDAYLSLSPSVMVYPTGQTRGEWVEVTMEYGRLGPMGRRGWILSSDLETWTDAPK